jgi:hypothetical protein
MDDSTARPTLDDLRREGATTTVVRAGQALGLGRTAAYQLANAGTIPTIRIGRSLRVPVDALIRMIDVEHLDLHIRPAEVAS